MAKAVSPRRTVCDRRPGPVIFVVGKVALEQVSVRALTCFSCQNDAGGDFGNLKKKINKSSALSEIGEHWIEKFCAIAQVVNRWLFPAVSIPAKCMYDSWWTKRHRDFFNNISISFH